MIPGGPSPTTGTRSDADSGDLMTAYQLEVWNNGPHQYSSPSRSGSVSGSPTTFSKSLTLPSGYNADALYDWRARTRDSGGPVGFVVRATRGSGPTAFPTRRRRPRWKPTPWPRSSAGRSRIRTPAPPCPLSRWRWSELATAADMWVSPETAKTAAPWTIPYAGAVLSWGKVPRPLPDPGQQRRHEFLGRLAGLHPGPTHRPIGHDPAHRVPAPNDPHPHPHRGPLVPRSGMTRWRCTPAPRSPPPACGPKPGTGRTTPRCPLRPGPTPEPPWPGGPPTGGGPGLRTHRGSCPSGPTCTRSGPTPSPPPRW